MINARDITAILEKGLSIAETRFQQTREYIGYWLPRHHVLAVGLLSGVLGVLFALPDSSDAHSGRTVINITTGETVQQSVPEPDADMDNEESAIRNELDEVLASTEFRIEQQNDTGEPPLVTEERVDVTTGASVIPGATDPRLIIEVASGDSLSILFRKAGLSDREIYEISQGNETQKDVLTRIFPGYKLAFDIREETLHSLEIIISPKESYTFSLGTDESYSVTHDVRTPELRQTYKQAVIQDSLFLAAQRGGIPAALTMEMAGIFGGVIDFMLDTRKGDSFTVLYEEQYLDGEFVGNGQILAASFTNQGETFTALRYVDSTGRADYYNPAGESMRKAFLKNPVDFVRISSDFNPNRRHPILNTIRAHRGTDYAAPTGTPVVATGDGRVTWASRNGTFGNLVVIQHNDRFETKYAHLSKYASGVRVGSRVRQGQVVGYVGSTGSATGPHLHFEFLMDGVHRNWRTIQDKLPKAEAIAAEELPRFHEQTSLVASRMESLQNPDVALLENQDSP